LLFYGFVFGLQRQTHTHKRYLEEVGILSFLFLHLSFDKAMNMVSGPVLPIGGASPVNTALRSPASS
jgi:hypothetical protein